MRLFLRLFLQYAAKCSVIQETTFWKTMKKLLSHFLLLLCFFLAQGVQAQNFTELWERFDKAYDSDLPASALEVLHTIRQCAVASADDAQLLRALVTESIIASVLSPDSTAVTERRILEAMAREHRPVERALWLSAYGQLTQNVDSLLASVAQPELLADASTDSYATLFTKGEDSRWMHHDLLSLLTEVVMNNTELLGLSRREANEAWQKMREVYTKRGNDVALLLMLAKEMQQKNPTTSEIAGFIAEIDRLMPRIKGTNVGNYMQKTKASLTSPLLTLKIKSPENGILYPGQSYPLYVSSRHVRRPEVRVWQLQGIAGRDLHRSSLYNEQEMKRLCSKAKPVLKQKIKVPVHQVPDHVSTNDTLSLKISEPGIYKIAVFEDGKIRDFTVVSCTRVIPVFLSYRQDSTYCHRLTLIDGLTGEPFRTECTLEYADVFRGKRGQQPLSWRPVQKNEGETFVLDGMKDVILHARVGTDDYLPLFDVPVTFEGYSSTTEVRSEARVYTDRAIYRPGQEVQFGGVVYSQNGDETRALPQWKGRITLLNPSRKEVMQTTVSTGEYGDFSGKFSLPDPIMPGIYQIRLFGNGLSRTSRIRIEEYKRPTFSVRLESPSPDSLYQRRNWAVGDTLTLTGTVKTYSGVPISGATVQWTTTRSTDFYHIYAHKAQAMAGGNVLTDADGRFEIGLRLTGINDESDGFSGASDWCRLNFTTECTVTANNGESVSASKHLYTTNPSAVEARQTAEVPVVSTKVSDDRSHGSIVIRQPGAWVFCDIAADKGGIVHSEVLQVTDSLRLDIEWKPEYGESATLHLAWYAQGNLETRDVTVERPTPDKRLVLSWSTFRNTLQPGENERWTLSVHRPDGTPANALVMTRLYDASLDAVARADWDFHIGFHRRSNPVRRLAESFYFNSRLQHSIPVRIPNLQFSEWQSTMFSYGVSELSQSLYLCEAKPLSNKALSMPRMAQGSQMKMTADYAAPAIAENGASTDELEEVATENAAEDVPIRENFDETAFFFPSLRTDSVGNVTMEFRLPESLTQWNFTAFAHDVRMNFGFLRDTVVARKELMTEIAAPRFLRHGDMTEIAVTVRNISSDFRSGTLSFFLSDAATGRSLQADKTRFALQSGASETYRFSIKADFLRLGIPADSIDVSDVLAEAMAQLLVKAVAVTDADGDGRRFSDGEQRGIPLLSGRVMVETAVPFTLQGRGSRTINVKALDLKRLMREDALCKPVVSVDYTDNPLWSVVRCVPNLLKDDAISANAHALRLYIVQIARYLTEQIPEAADLLPPQTSIEALRYSALDRLKERQNADGGFSWMPGFRSSFWVTVDVSMLLARQQCLTRSDIAAEMLQKAMGYMERNADEAVLEMQRNHLGDAVSETLMRYLYVRTLLDLEPRSSEKHLLKHAAGMRKELTMYGKALQARVLAEAAAVAGMPKNLSTSCVVAADLAMQSLVEHSVSTPEMGRYFDTPRAERGWKSYRIPTQVAAIEALSDRQLLLYRDGWLAKQDAGALRDEMMLWLLQSKRTQLWESSRASADATYALLQGYDAEGRTFQPLTPEGHWQRTLDAQETKALVNSGGYTLASDHDGLAWGSLRARYSVRADAAEYAGSGLSVERRWQVKHQEGWTDLPDGAAAQAAMLTPGTRVRQVITVVAERDFDHVCVEAGRAACMEPVEPLSGNVRTESLWTYRMVRDVRNDYFIEHLPKGKHTLHEEYFVDRSGHFSTGLVHVFCAYAPEFAGFAPASTLDSGMK